MRMASFNDDEDNTLKFKEGHSVLLVIDGETEDPPEWWKGWKVYPESIDQFKKLEARLVPVTTQEMIRKDMKPKAGYISKETADHINQELLDSLVQKTWGDLSNISFDTGAKSNGNHASTDMYTKAALKKRKKAKLPLGALTTQASLDSDTNSPKSKKPKTEEKGQFVGGQDWFITPYTTDMPLAFNQLTNNGLTLVGAQSNNCPNGLYTDPNVEEKYSWLVKNDSHNITLDSRSYDQVIIVNPDYFFQR